ncbi:MAG: phosphopyruvate hydratase [Nanoarchaeota archaeon]|nr:phosphopyruvate hydratase [Nanoarchaeota archaeon]
MKINHIQAIEILDSRGNPTVKVEMLLEDGSFGDFSVPSGASTGIHEAHELRDEDPLRYHKKGVLKVIENINSIKNDLYKRSFTQTSLDEFLITKDGTTNKNNLGANAILGISIAFAKACSKHYNLPLYEYLHRLYENKGMRSKTTLSSHTPLLFSNIINGGEHADNDLMVQECMIICNSRNIQESVRKTSEVYQSLKSEIKKKYGAGSTGLGDEGGFAPNVKNVEDSFNLITKVLKHLNYTSNFVFAIDAAASEFYNEKEKTYEIEKGKKVKSKELNEYYKELISKFPLVSIEDSFSEDDFSGFASFQKMISKLSKEENPFSNILSVGDDLLVTNPQRIKLGIEKQLCNALLLKINQIGTLTESFKAAKLAQEQGWSVIVSHRSGETIDSFISDLAVAIGGEIKLGAPARGERVAKYNRLLEICRNFN